MQHPSVSAGLFDLIISNCSGCIPKNIPIIFHLAAYSGRTYPHKSFISGRLASTHKKVINKYVQYVYQGNLQDSQLIECVHNYCITINYTEIFKDNTSVKAYYTHSQ